MSISKENFGVTPEGKEILLYTLKNENGMTAKLTNYGAVLVSLLVPDKQGNFDDVVLGYDKAPDYFVNNPGFGSTIGRHANRIARSEATINGITYHLDKNEGENNLHSGFVGYNKVLWEVTELDGIEPAIVFSRLSPDGEQGFPGNFQVKVTYKLTNENEVQIIYDGKSDKDTIVNMTNHSYFNLSGHSSGTIINHKLWLNADKFTPMGSGSIPTGEIRDVANTPMDFTVLKEVGKEIDSDYEQIRLGSGYDHNYVLNIDGKSVEKIALLVDEASGRSMEVYTDLPGVQLYTGNFISNESGKEGAKYQKRDGICLETQYFPDAIHHESFPSSVLKANEEYHTTTIFKFTR